MPVLQQSLSAEQADARAAILEFAGHSARDILAIGGAAGTGKSHLLTNVAHGIPGIVAHGIPGIKLAAPTNVAGSRLRNNTGLPASTLHRLPIGRRGNTQQSPERGKPS